MQLLHKLEQERLAILDKIGKIRFMRRGTVNEQYFMLNIMLNIKIAFPLSGDHAFFLLEIKMAKRKVNAQKRKSRAGSTGYYSL